MINDNIIPKSIAKMAEAFNITEDDVANSLIKANKNIENKIKYFKNNAKKMQKKCK